MDQDELHASDWYGIQRAAKAGAYDRQEDMPLAAGQDIAWAECRLGYTDHLTVVHRVGARSLDDHLTVCGERIPAAVLHLVLSPRLTRSLGRCPFCEAEWRELPPTAKESII